MTKRKLKICSPQLGLDPNSFLGGEVHDHNMLNQLAIRGHKIFIYIPKGRSYKKHKNISAKMFPVKHIPAFLFNFLIIPYLFNIYNEEKFDILRVHNPYFVGLGALFFKLFNPQVSVVTTLHLKEEAFVFNLINKVTLNRYDRIITVSSYLKKWIHKNYAIREKMISVIYNGVSKDLKPTNKNESLMSRYRLENKIVLLFMGLLIKRKNPLFLLRIYKILKLNNNKLALVISGDGPLKRQMVSFIKKNELKDVIFTGNVSDNNKLDVFNLSDIFVFPSKEEGFGLVVAEAMSCAKPVVTSNNSALKEIINDKVDGFLADTHNIDDWVSKIEVFLKDKELRSEIGNKALIKSKQKYSWQKASTEYEKLLLSLNAS